MDLMPRGQDERILRTSKNIFSNLLHGNRHQDFSWNVICHSFMLKSISPQELCWQLTAKSLEVQGIGLHRIINVQRGALFLHANDHSKDAIVKSVLFNGWMKVDASCRIWWPLSRCSSLLSQKADRMLDMGFEPQIRKILVKVPRRAQHALAETGVLKWFRLAEAACCS